MPRAAVSGRSVSRGSRYAVEIGIGAGKIGKPMDAHRCNDQRIVMQKASLLSGFGGEIQPGRADGEDPDGEQGGTSLNGLTKSRQRLHLGWMVSNHAVFLWIEFGTQGNEVSVFPAAGPADQTSRSAAHRSRRAPTLMRVLFVFLKRQRPGPA